MLSIRSQDKWCLVPYDKPIVIVILEKDKWVLEMIEFRHYLGAYATEKRALEVLDEIQEKVNGKILISQNPTPNENHFSYVYNGHIDNSNIVIIPTVYEMPKE